MRNAAVFEDRITEDAVSTQDRPQNESRLLRMVATILCAILVTLSLAMLARVSWSRYTLTQDRSEYAIVSARSQVADAGISGVSGSLRYLRADAPFAHDLARTFQSDPASPLHVYRFVDQSATGEVARKDPEGFVSARLAAVSDAGFFPWTAVAALLGTVVGLYWVFDWQLAPCLIVALLGVALAKVATQCPTCPTATIAGIDVAVLGCVLYAALALATSVWRSASLRQAALLVIGFVVLWQLLTTWSVQATCVPCALVAFLSSAGLASALHWKSVPANRPLRPSWQAWSLACLPMFGAFVNGTSDPLAIIAQGESGSSSWGVRAQDVRNLQELGLPGFGHKTVLFIGHRGCRPCEDALSALDAAGIQGLTFGSGDADAPDAKRAWVKIPDMRAIRQTPTILFANADGTVQEQILGGRTDVAGLTAFSQQVQTFFSTAPTKGKGRP